MRCPPWFWTSAVQRPSEGSMFRRIDLQKSRIAQSRATEDGGSWHFLLAGRGVATTGWYMHAGSQLLKINRAGTIFSTFSNINDCQDWKLDNGPKELMKLEELLMLEWMKHSATSRGNNETRVWWSIPTDDCICRLSKFYVHLSIVCFARLHNKPYNACPTLQFAPHRNTDQSAQRECMAAHWSFSHSIRKKIEIEKTSDDALNDIEYSSNVKQFMRIAAKHQHIACCVSLVQSWRTDMPLATRLITYTSRSEHDQLLVLEGQYSLTDFMMFPNCLHWKEGEKLAVYNYTTLSEPPSELPILAF